MRRRIVFAGCLFLGLSAMAADWPQYRGGADRGGYTPEDLSGPLHVEWRFMPAHPPMPAWRGQDTRMGFDYAHHAAVADGRLYFGSSADHKVYALDAASGELIWTYFTEGPVRFAPAVLEGRVFVCSDDGCLHALAADDGHLLWKMRGGPGPDIILGNDRPISRWPARGGVAVLGNTLYFSAGIWPSEGIYLYALDPENGAVRWSNTDSGSMEIDQPHPTAHANSGISAQGYLAASPDHLLVPTGRAIPASFHRTDGTLATFRLQEFGHVYGGAVVAAAPYYVNDSRIFDAETGDDRGKLPGNVVAVTPDWILCAGKEQLQAWERRELFRMEDAVDRKGNPYKRAVLTSPVFSMPIPEGVPRELIAAGRTAIWGTEAGGIFSANLDTGALAWQTKTEGAVLGLAAANGRLYVSTDAGEILCFGPQAPSEPRLIRAPMHKKKRSAPPAVAKLAGVTEGFCVDLGCGDGSLSAALAQSTDLTILAVEPDEEKAAAARARLDALGLYGTRVSVYCAPLGEAPFAAELADVVVSGRGAAGEAIPREEALRLARPYGGKVCLDGKDLFEKGAVEGAGAWTHQYASPANTCNSGDTRVQGSLAVRWFRDSDYDMPSRHGRGPAPLFWEGRLYVEGLDGIRCANAYNGRTLWEYSLPKILAAYDQEHLVGTAGTNSNLCLENGVLYVARGNECLCIDGASGALLHRHTPPDTDGRWGYLACAEGVLYGSIVNTEHVVHWAYRESDMDDLYTESRSFFALDAQSGKVLWQFTPTHSVRHNAIAIAGGKVFLIDRPLDVMDSLTAQEAKRRGETVAVPENLPLPILHALDAKTGQAVWTVQDNIYGTLLAVDEQRGVLLMTQQHTRFKLPSEQGGQMTAFNAATGQRMWEAASDPQGKASRPLLIGGVIYNEPGAWDLLTGQRLDFTLERSYGCGIMSGCEQMLLYRSATLGYTDPAQNEGTKNYGGIRPGCWINAIPAGGLVLMPDATARCTCSYLIKAWIALAPAHA